MGRRSQFPIGPKALEKTHPFFYNINMTKVYIGALCALFLLAEPPAYAQLRNAIKTLPRLTAQVNRAALAALRQQAFKPVLPLLRTESTSSLTVKPALIPADIRRSVFTVQATPDSKHKGSAFAVNIDGRVWGVTARHVMDDINHTPFMTFPGENGEPVTLLAKPSQEGSAAGADVALFEIPPQALKFLRPLELEEELPPAHSVLASSGFAHGNFLSQPAREVLFASQHRILTKYVSFNLQESGYCGSPLLKNGKVAAVHVGSLLSDAHQAASWYTGTLGPFEHKIHDVSLAVPAAWLRTLARQAQRMTTPDEGVPLVFNGLHITRLQPEDSIVFIMQLRNGRVLKTLPRYPFMDLAHLETFFDILPGDSFRLEVQSKKPNAPSRQTYWYEWTAGEGSVTKMIRR